MAQSPAAGTGPAGGGGHIPPRAPAWPAAPACPPAGTQFSSRLPLGAGQPAGAEGHCPSTSGNPAFCGILRLRRALSPKEAVVVSARIGSGHASVTKYHSLASLSDGGFHGPGGWEVQGRGAGRLGVWRGPASRWQTDVSLSPRVSERVEGRSRGSVSRAHRAPTPPRRAQDSSIRIWGVALNALMSVSDTDVRPTWGTWQA